VAIADVQPLTPPPKASPKTAPKPSEVKKVSVEAPEVNAQAPSNDKDKAKAPAVPKKENLALFSWRVRQDRHTTHVGVDTPYIRYTIFVIDAPTHPFR
jgi:hypothetical protein